VFGCETAHFTPIAQSAPELICQLNHAFIRGIVEGLHARTIECGSPPINAAGRQSPSAEAPRRRPRVAVGGTAPEGSFPVAIVGAHGVLAVTTLILVVLTMVGIGAS
jgi:hypothetical protein